MMRRLEAVGPLVGAILAVWLLLPLAHAVLGVPPTEMEMLVASHVPAVFVVLWMTDDAYRRRCTPCHDFGFLMWYAFPLTLLGYLIWTRGWWGLAVFVGLLAITYLPAILGTAISLAALR